MTNCPICFEDKSLYKISDCGHKFCDTCNQECRSVLLNCPICRQSIKRDPSYFSFDKELSKMSKIIGL